MAKRARKKRGEMGEERDDVPGGGYSPAHPWYYVLGGTPLPVEEIHPLKSDRSENDLVPRRKKAGSRVEAIEMAITEAEEALAADVKRYHELIEFGNDAIGEYEKSFDIPGKCNAIHSALAGKHNHILYHKTVIARLKSFLVPGWEPGDPEPKIRRHAKTPSLF